MEEITKRTHVIGLNKQGAIESFDDLHAHYSKPTASGTYFRGDKSKFASLCHTLNPKVEDWDVAIKQGSLIYIPVHTKEQGEAEGEAATNTTKSKESSLQEQTTSHAPTPQTAEKSKESTASSKPNRAGIHPICNGAKCSCDKSKVAKKLADFAVVTKVNTTINDKEGSSKLVGTTEDKPLPFKLQSATFGDCLAQPIIPGISYKPCVPNIIQWNNAYEGVQLSNGGNLLLKDSIGDCSFGGKINFETHGQESSENKKDMAPELLIATSALTPLITEEELQQALKGAFKDIEGVGVLEIELTKGKKLNHKNVAEIELEATKVSGKKKGRSKSGINWVVYHKFKESHKYERVHTFIDHGDILVFEYRQRGYYKIEGYGQKAHLNKKNVATKKARNIIELRIAPQSVEAGSLRLLVDGQDRTKMKKVRPGEAFQLQVSPLFADLPPLEKYIWYVNVTHNKETTDVGCITKTNFIHIQPQPEGAEIEAILVDRDGEEIEKYTFQVGNNFVKGIKVDKDTICVKTHIEKARHILSAKVSKWAIEPPTAAEEAAVQWVAYQESTKNMEAIGTGAKLTKTSDAVGQWYVEAYMKGPEGPGRPTSKHISVVKPSIKKAYWADQDGNPLSRSGYRHTVYIHIETQGLVGEKLQLHVWEMQKGKDRYVQNAKKDIELTHANGNIVQEFELPKAPHEEELDKQSEYFFTLSHFPENVANAWQDPECNNQFRLIPNNKTELLYVKPDEKIINFRILEEGNKPHIGILPYGKTVTIKIQTRNMVGQSLEFEVWEDIKKDNHTDAYSWYDTRDDRKTKEKIYIDIDKHGLGETTFTIPSQWKQDHGKDENVPRWFYFKYKEQEFPSAFYMPSPNTDHKKVKSQMRIKALMLKVAVYSELDEATEKSSMVILGEQYKDPTKTGEACETLRWGAHVSCAFRKKLINICKDLWGEDKKIEMANEMMDCMYVETSGTFSSSVTRLVSKEVTRKGKKETIRVYEGYSKEAHRKDKSLVSNRAVGLIQFTGVAAQELGITKQELALMTEIEQLDYVKKYFEIDNRHKKVTNSSEMYLTIFCPNGLDKDRDYVLYSKEKDVENKNNYYKSNRSIDEENNNDGKIQRWEAISRVLNARASGLFAKNRNNCKDESNTTCAYKFAKGTEDKFNGVLDEMKELADKHIPYSKLGERGSLSAAGMKALDCSEFVGIYLHKLGVMPTYKAIYTGNMITQNAFRKAIGSDMIDWVSGSDKEGFVPKRGDIFVWRNGNDGHTGIVYSHDATNDLVTILEAIGKYGSRDSNTNANNGGYTKNNCTRTSVYKRNKEALFEHAGWKGYFRPKNYTKKL
ncbi:MAG: DUF4280 domain-containing protein [Flavobacteriaceae bacterium]|nr:DUF4280 domain-containing protein [Flavobacteriaceae bacterium]